MSYIRCLSNPEGLYIWADVSGYTTFSIDGKILVGGKNRYFDGLIRRYKKCYWFGLDKKSLIYKGYRLREVFVLDKKKPIIEKEYQKAVGRKYEGDFKIELSYRNKWKILMWKVTWEYICN